MWTLSSGAGQPVVFVHGALSDARFWQPQLDVIGRTHHAIAVSLHGYYPKLLDDWSGFSAERHVADLCDFLLTLEMPVHLVGHSRGGRVALHVATRCPQAIRSLVLVEPGGEVDPDFLLPTRQSSPSLSSINVREQAEALVRSGEPDRAMHLYVDGGHGNGVWDGLPPEVRTILRDNAHTIFGMIRDHSTPLSVAVARAVSAPSLLMSGSDSPAIFGRVLDALQHYLPKSERISVSGADHFLPCKQATDFNDALLIWLRRK